MGSLAKTLQLSIFFSSERCGGAKVTQTRRPEPGVNLRRALRIGFWNIPSLSQNERLPVLSGELKRLGIGVAALSEVRRPGSGETSSWGYTYYWSGCSNGSHTRGVAVAISDRFRSSVPRSHELQR